MFILISLPNIIQYFSVLSSIFVLSPVILFSTQQYQSTAFDVVKTYTAPKDPSGPESFCGYKLFSKSSEDISKQKNDVKI